MHTRGPWKLGQISMKQTTFKGPYIDILTPNGYGQPAIAAGRTQEETQANAKLIAAAPELLAVCKDMLYHINSYNIIDQIDTEEATGLSVILADMYKTIKNAQGE